jgi:hypothetical protein
VLAIDAVLSGLLYLYPSWNSTRDRHRRNDAAPGRNAQAVNGESLVITLGDSRLRLQSTALLCGAARTGMFSGTPELPAASARVVKLAAIALAVAVAEERFDWFEPCSGPRYWRMQEPWPQCCFSWESSA